MSLIDDIRKALQDKEKKSIFIDQMLKEEAFYDALRNAGLTVTAADPTERGRVQPYGILSKVVKVDLVDLITAITTIGTVINVTSIDLIDLINRIEEITTIGTIQSILGSVDPYSLTSKTKVLDKLTFTYDASGNIETVKGYEGASQKYTLTFTWVAGVLTQIVRT